MRRTVICTFNTYFLQVIRILLKKRKKKKVKLIKDKAKLEHCYREVSVRFFHNFQKILNR